MSWYWVLTQRDSNMAVAERQHLAHEKAMNLWSCNVLVSLEYWKSNQSLRFCRHRILLGVSLQCHKAASLQSRMPKTTQSLCWENVYSFQTGWLHGCRFGLSALRPVFINVWVPLKKSWSKDTEFFSKWLRNTQQMLASALPGKEAGRDLHTLIAPECPGYSVSLFTTLLGNVPSGGSASRNLKCTLPEILLSAHFHSEHTAQLVSTSISQEEGGVHGGNK